VPSRKLDDDRPIAEYVVIGVLHQDGLGVFELAVLSNGSQAWSVLGEHCRALRFLHDPR